MSLPTVLVLPYPAQGHVNPLMTLSLKLVENGCKVIFVNTEFNHKRVVSSKVEQLDSIDHSLLKLVSIPDGLGPDDDRTNLGNLCDAMLSTMPSTLEKLIEDIHMNSDNRISFIVSDLSMGWAIGVGKKLGIKGAIIWPASAAVFALMYSITKLMDDGIIDSDCGSLTGKQTIQISPNMPEMDPKPFFRLHPGDRFSDKLVINYVVHCTQSLNLTQWWLCNTTDELEPGPLSFIPNLLSIGPLLRSNYDKTSVTRTSIGQFWEEDMSCPSWLDQHPHHSVLYVAFGSFTLFDQNQFDELALALDLTNRPFLWVVRQDPNCTNKMAYPDEFLGSQGKIVGWAPQQKVLRHPAIACFVSHCGWNSTMEGLSNGVPFLCWPYFGDQIYNKAYICDELKVGLGFESDKNGHVSRKEFKMKVDQLLSDKSIKSRSLELKENVMNNIIEGGQSSKNFKKFVKWLKE